MLKAREKIDNSEPVFKASLDKIANWKFSSDGIVPEILLLYHHGSSPTTSPYNLLKEGKGRPAFTADGRYHSSSTSPSRSGQSTFSSEGIKRRNVNKCVFCDATEKVTAVHLVTFKEIDSSNKASLKALFTMCRISNIQASENGITLCQSCHEQFNHHFVKYLGRCWTRRRISLSKGS